MSAEDLIKDALVKGKIANKKRKIVERSEEPKTKSFIPNRITLILAIYGTLVLSGTLFRHSTFTSIVLLTLFILSAIIYLFRKRIHISNQNAYYCRNVLTSIGVLLGFLILANHNYLTKRYCKIFMDTPRFNFEIVKI